ncbi:TOBE domain-containing protein, partial [Caldimonas sp.]|uniref:TOBE domain-containing protein n=1 Tax=Caldimonas sp. TaxID=2838790 RepID=UPI00391C1DAD
AADADTVFHLQAHWAVVVPLLAGAAAPGEVLTLGVRPEHLALCREGEGWAARIDLVEHLGDALIVHASLRGEGREPLAVRLAPGQSEPAVGQSVGLRPDPQHLLLFDPQGRALQ